MDPLRHWEPFTFLSFIHILISSSSFMQLMCQNLSSFYLCLDWTKIWVLGKGRGRKDNHWSLSFFTLSTIINPTILKSGRGADEFKKQWIQLVILQRLFFSICYDLVKRGPNKMNLNWKIWKTKKLSGNLLQKKTSGRQKDRKTERQKDSMKVTNFKIWTNAENVQLPRGGASFLLLEGFWGYWQVCQWPVSPGWFWSLSYTLYILFWMLGDIISSFISGAFFLVQVYSKCNI